MGYTFTKETNHMANEDYRKYVVMSKSNHSYSLNNKITSKFNKDSWLAGRCFIIGGGESLKGFDFNRLNGRLTIGINKSFEHYSKATINYSMDVVLYQKMQQGKLTDASGVNLWEKWMAFEGTRVFLTPMGMMTFGKEVHLVRREWTPKINREDLDSGIYGGVNSGTGAINLAIALGSREIYLLGYDFKCSTQSHWHSGYGPRNLVDFDKKLKEYSTEITKLFAAVKNLGINIYNANPNSALTCFPFCDINKVLEE